MVSFKTFAPVAILLSALNIASAAPVANVQAAEADVDFNATALEARARWPKRGLPFNNPPRYIQRFKGGGSQVNWAYNWESRMAPDFPKYLEYVPMLWGAGGDKVGPWAGNVNNALSRGSGHIMAFNEPDKCWGGVASCMTPQYAVDMYRQHMMPFARRASLGAPAVTSDQSGGPVGLNWLRDFMARCGGCKIDFVPIHWYGGHDQEANFRTHIQNARDAARGRPIWITEFKAFGSKEQQIAFLRRNMPWLDNQPYVARYAWFWASPDTNPTSGTLVRPGGEPGNLGKVYTYTPFGRS